MLIFLSQLIFNVGFGQIKNGDIAPEITYNKSFPEAYNLPVKKAILLDFWATWCQPCIEGIKETNNWVAKYKDNIEFVCITNHTSKNVDKFIKKLNLNHVFLIDSTNQTFKKFGVGPLPDVFLIDTNGIIIWRGHSTDVTESFLNEFISTGRISSPNRSATISMNDVITNSFKKTSDDQINGPSIFGIKPIDDSIKYFIINNPLQEIIEKLYNKPKQVIFNQKHYSTHYDLQVSQKYVDKTTNNLQVLEAISKLAPFNYRIENRDTSVIELIVINEEILFSHLTRSDSILGGDYPSVAYETTNKNIEKLSAENVTIEELSHELAENVFNQPVIITSSIYDKFDFKQIPISDYDQLCLTLESNYGILIRRASLRIPFLIIE